MAGDTIRTWVLTPIERSVLRVMLQAHKSGTDWLGLTNIAIPAGLSLDAAAVALAKPVQLGYVEQHGQRGAIYQLTAEGRRIAAAKQDVVRADGGQDVHVPRRRPPRNRARRADGPHRRRTGRSGTALV